MRLGLVGLVLRYELGCVVSVVAPFVREVATLTGVSGCQSWGDVDILVEAMCLQVFWSMAAVCIRL